MLNQYQEKCFLIIFVCCLNQRSFDNSYVFLNRFNLKKLSYEERKAKLIERLNAFNSVADDDDEDDE